METSTTTDLVAHIERVTPPDVDPLDGLTVRELDIASRQLGEDVYSAVTGQGRHRWKALALLAWLWAKRLDPQAKLDPFMDYLPVQLNHALRIDELPDADDADAVDDPTANPTDPAHVS